MSAVTSIVDLKKRRQHRSANIVSEEDDDSKESGDLRSASPAVPADDAGAAPAVTTASKTTANGSPDASSTASSPTENDAVPSTPTSNVVATTVDPDFTKLHPLEYEWTFWYDKRQVNGRRQKGEMHHYETNLKEIGDFSTVEDFWRYFHHIVKPSQMEVNANCHLFKKNIKPMWEDDENANGGKWVVVVRGERAFLDQLWENVVLSIIGETIGDSNEICGAVCSRRKKGDKIAIWNRTKSHEAAIMEIGRNFKQLLGASAQQIPLTYQFHEDALKTTTSYSNPVHYKL